ncbi:phosphoribosylanthranilate isomerase [Bacillus sp. RD4P76]|uniref:N-(5'-phosphoribosyl)anthranilate isomerase n=2 Tax=Bacillus suaedaesalsae TaxID=2810349 RepID=A0ABS2DNC0_9BACI|nr:phosphoribosylanthranilate isomerase [Bacillus suaedaesalsae]MBM6619857.1 phosphoribosylanthranilate isomerase [Bacillus suaedaesalsae]
MSKPLLKYCGNRCFEDWCLVMESKADLIGLIFAESKRKVSPETVVKWIDEKPVTEGKKIVGVFVNASLSYIEHVASCVPLDIIQCHGRESIEELCMIKALTKLPVWKAIHHDIHAILCMRNLRGIADGYVIDTKSINSWGGTGESFDWSVIPEYQKEAFVQEVPCLIAGGVNPTNISKLLAHHVDGIDISSGIEYENRKNIERIKLIDKEVDCYVHNLSR